MPTLADALRFARDPQTTAAKLRRACTLLGLAADGDDRQLRARLEAHLCTLDEERPVVCLNPAAAPREE